MLIENKKKSGGENSGSHPGMKESPAVKPPDGGWGWMVVFGSFMIHLIADGMAYSFGVYVESFLEEFNATRSQVGFLGSLMLGITWLSGPIAGVLTKIYGCRMVAIIGTVIAAAGFLISIFAPNIYFMFFSFGLIAGVGLGFAYLPAIVAVSFYFEKRRSLATGLAVCGSGVGTIIFAPLTEKLLEKYGWKGTVLIEVGILLNCIPCGAVFRTLEPPRRKARPLADQAEGAAIQEMAKTTNDGNDPLLETRTPKEPLQKNLEIVKKDLKMSQQKLEGPDDESKISHHSALSSSNNLEALDNVSKSNVDKDSISSRRNVNANAVPSDKDEVTTANPMDRKDVFYTRSLQNIPAYEADPDQYRKSVTSIPQHTEAPSADKEGNFSSLCSSISKTMDCNLMSDPCFLLFAVSNLLTSVGFTVPYIFLPNRATVDGMTPQQGAYLISMIGLTNTIGRILFGFLADFKWVNRLFLYNTALVICGGLSLISAVCNNFPSMAVYAAGYGLFMGVFICLTPVVLVDLLGLEKLSMSFGIVLLFQGIGTIVGPPIAGAVYDITKQYDNSFYLAGVCVLISGAMLYVIPSIQRRRREKIQSVETTA